MCYQYMKIKSVSPNGPKFGFIPCGKCEECRQTMKNGWTFRLAAELENCKKLGWKTGFFTLTYNDMALPHLPRCVFKSQSEWKPISCFSKSDVRNFILRLRKYIWKHYRIISIKYMICAEYGSSTKRPHYHGIISWPSHDDRRPDKVLTAEVMHSLITRFWISGFVFPRYPDGGQDSNGYIHNPFEVSDVGFRAANYAAKYCCKDLTFMRSFDGLDIDKKSKVFRDCDCFHLQSRSLGICCLAGLTDSQKLDLYKNGRSFFGSDRLIPIPIYIKNHIVFDIKYIYKLPDGSEVSKALAKGLSDFGIDVKRLVRRSANQFFKDNLKEIFDCKSSFYETLFDDAIGVDHWLALNIEQKLAVDVSGLLSSYMMANGLSSRSLAEYYLAYYGVPYERCFDVSPCVQWCSRYDCSIDFNDVPLFDADLKRSLDALFSFVLGSYRFADNTNPTQDVIDFVSDFHRSTPY